LSIVPCLCSAEGQRGVGGAFLVLVLIFSLIVTLIIGYIVKGIIYFTKYKLSDKLVFGLTYLAVFVFIIIWLSYIFS
jgi:hypothetical protein